MSESVAFGGSTMCGELVAVANPEKVGDGVTILKRSSSRNEGRVAAISFSLPSTLSINLSIGLPSGKVEVMLEMSPIHGRSPDLLLDES